MSLMDMRIFRCRECQSLFYASDFDWDDVDEEEIECPGCGTEGAMSDETDFQNE